VPLANPAPVAKFTIAPSVGIVNEPVTFDARTTTDDGEPCLSRCTYMWDFGDGTSLVPGMVVSHTYSAAPLLAGYTVTLTVVDERNGVGSTQQTFTVMGTPAVARFTVSPATPQVGVEATFDASGSTVASGAVIQLYTWNFGDGDIQQTTTPTIKKRYDEARLFSVTLTITPNSGPASTVGQSVQVIP
jgi:PKD repeat protein